MVVQARNDRRSRAVPGHGCKGAEGTEPTRSSPSRCVVGGSIQNYLKHTVVEGIYIEHTLQ